MVGKGWPVPVVDSGLFSDYAPLHANLFPYRDFSVCVNQTYREAMGLCRTGSGTSLCCALHSF